MRAHTSEEPTENEANMKMNTEATEKMQEDATETMYVESDSENQPTDQVPEGKQISIIIIRTGTNLVY